MGKVKRQSALSILYEDADVVAVDKPAGLAAIPGRAETTCLVEQAANQLHLPWTGDTDPRLRVVHRLDKDTSGVMIFAKHLEAQRLLSHQFQNNTVEKEYLALVCGRVQEDAGEIDAPIGVHPTDKTRMVTTKHGRPARTLWKVEQRFRDCTLLRVFPKTGKTHQIRVHLASIGHRLLIDPIYNRGGKQQLLLSDFKRDYRGKKGEEERPLMARLTLHAHQLRLALPSAPVKEIVAPIPKDFRAAQNMLEKYAR